MSVAMAAEMLAGTSPTGMLLAGVNIVVEMPTPFFTAVLGLIVGLVVGYGLGARMTTQRLEQRAAWTTQADAAEPEPAPEEAGEATPTQPEESAQPQPQAATPPSTEEPQGTGDTTSPPPQQTPRQQPPPPHVPPPPRAEEVLRLAERFGQAVGLQRLGELRRATTLAHEVIAEGREIARERPQTQGLVEAVVQWEQSLHTWTALLRNELGLQRLGFGQHRNMLRREVLTNHRSYIKWCLSREHEESRGEGFNELLAYLYCFPGAMLEKLRAGRELTADLVALI